MRLRKYKPMTRPDGKRRHIRIPQCQHVENGKQCEKAVYDFGKCWEHFEAPKLPSLGGFRINF